MLARRRGGAAARRKGGAAPRSGAACPLNADSALRRARCARRRRLPTHAARAQGAQARRKAAIRWRNFLAPVQRVTPPRSRSMAAAYVARAQQVAARSAEVVRSRLVPSVKAQYAEVMAKNAGACVSLAPGRSPRRPLRRAPSPADAPRATRYARRVRGEGSGCGGEAGQAVRVHQAGQARSSGRRTRVRGACRVGCRAGLATRAPSCALGAARARQP